MNLVPLGDRVVLKQLKEEETTQSGIVLPGQNKEILWFSVHIRLLKKPSKPSIQISKWA